MIRQGEIKSLINLDLDFLRSYAQSHPDPWGTSQPHNAHKETPFPHIMGLESRLASGQITPLSVFHSSVMCAPKELQSPDGMITMDNIQETFGPEFKPQYAVLNEFEQFCKDNWVIEVRCLCF